jgi:DNA-binding XRE family transcriptional regulator
MASGGGKTMAHGTNRLRDLRGEHGLALWGLAARAGVSASTLSAIEKWDYLPTSPVRRRIAAALGVEASAIWPECGISGGGPDGA